jgi:regulator of sirC expression with transglutaminase-like and TPR domain
MITSTLSLPLCCCPDAFKLLTRQVPVLDSTDGLLHGAIAISMHQMEGVKPERVDGMLQKYADEVRSRVRGDQPQALLAHLHEYLFEEVGFKGNAEDYYNTINSYLPAVLHTKRGLPITLSLIYKTVAERLGLKSWGVALPGHFLAAVEFEGKPMLVDAFNGGRIVTEEEAQGRMQEMFGEEMEWSEEMIRPASNRVWLTRMLQNLLNLFGTGGHYADVAAVLEMEMLLWPEQERLKRDLALVLARLGLSQPAAVWLDQYLKGNPEDPQKDDLEQLRAVLGA